MKFRSQFSAWTLVLVLGIPGLSFAQSDAFEAHWRDELVRLQGWPSAARREGNILAFATERQPSCQMRYDAGPLGSQLPAVLYLLDRDAPDSFTPTSSHRWAILDVRALLSSAGLSRDAPNAEQLPFHEAVLTAVRALDVLAGQQRGHTPRVGIVGEGHGGAVALALAALRPDPVAFVCAHEPTDPVVTPARQSGRNRAFFARWQEQAAEAAQLVSLTQFAALVKAPTLITLGENDQTAPPDTVLAVQAALQCRSELVPMRRARHCQPSDLRDWQELWREWTRTALGYE